MIVGCGIAGPATALFLRRAGIPAVIFEGRDEPDDHAGAFLNLMPNGLRVLEILGLLEEVSRAGHATNTFSFMTESGSKIGELDLDDVPSPSRFKSVLIQRGLLNKILREAAHRSGISVTFGKRLIDLTERTHDGVEVRFEDGTSARGPALIGCDGVHSRTRQLMLPGSPHPSYTGLMNAGTILQQSPVPASTTMTMMFGRRAFFGYQAVPTGELYWFSNFPSTNGIHQDGVQSGASEAKEQLKSLYASSPCPIPDIVQGLRGPIGLWPTYDLPSLPTWHSSRICLAGDAAHAASPSAGSGASLALEDALVLAKCMRDVRNLSDAFALYESRRKSRAEQIVRQARRNDRQKLMTNPVGIWLRDRLMPFFFKFGDRAMSKIYSYEVDW